MSRVSTGPAPARAAPMGAATTGLSVAVVIFFIGLVLPYNLNLGPLRMSPYRLVLIIAFFPCVFLWLQGAAGRIRAADICVVVLCVWSALSYAVLHGPASGIEAGGILTMETMGAYFLGRVFIRTADQFYRMARLFFIIIMALLPLLILEEILGYNITLELLKIIPLQTYNPMNMDPRWGLRRAQVVFQHPILYGVFVGAAVGLTFFVVGYGRAFLVKCLMAGTVAIMAFFSLSSGPLVGVMTQIGMIGWEWLFRNWKARWTALSTTVGSIVLVLEIVATRSTPALLISVIAFNATTAYNRLRIFEYGTKNVLANPVFGIGLNDWARLPGMTSSVDMFWIVPAMRHGLVAGAMTMAVFWLVFLGATFRKGLDARTFQFRIGYLITMFGFFLAGWTVHYWNAVYVLFIFLLGAGVWFQDAPGEEDGAGEADAAPDPVAARRAGHALRRTAPETAPRATPAPVAPRAGPDTASRRPGDLPFSRTPPKPGAGARDDLPTSRTPPKPRR